MEILSTKQQQKQKQNQEAKNYDHDPMDIFDKWNRLCFVVKMGKYFDATADGNTRLTIPILH